MNDMMNKLMNKLMSNLMNNRLTPAAWRRLVSMVVLITCYGMAETLLLASVVFQVASVFVCGSPNTQARAFGAQLSSYMYQLFLYLTYNSDRRPFPFAAWPEKHPSLP